MVVKCLHCDWRIPFSGDYGLKGFEPDTETQSFMLAHTIMEHEGNANYLVKHEEGCDLKEQLKWMRDVHELNRMYDLPDPR
jgi:hypothetical protein